MLKAATEAGERMILDFEDCDPHKSTHFARFLRMYRLDALRKLKGLTWLEPGSNDHYLALKFKRAYNFSIFKEYCPSNGLVTENECKRFIDHNVDYSDELFEMSRDFLMNLDYNDERLF